MRYSCFVWLIIAAVHGKGQDKESTTIHLIVDNFNSGWHSLGAYTLSMNGVEQSRPVDQSKMDFVYHQTFNGPTNMTIKCNNALAGRSENFNGVGEIEMHIQIAVSQTPLVSIIRGITFGNVFEYGKIILQCAHNELLDVWIDTDGLGKTEQKRAVAPGAPHVLVWKLHDSTVCIQRGATLCPGCTRTFMCNAQKGTVTSD